MSGRQPMRDKQHSVAKAIELKVDHVSQLFVTLDPFPFRERVLDNDTEEFIVGWARELPRDQPLKVIVHVPEAEATTLKAAELPSAFARYFNDRAEVSELDLKELFRVGWRALAIGLVVLASCIIVGQMITGRVGQGYFGRFVEESLVILAWVANWRPIEILLYDWWPLLRRRNLYLRLAAA